MFFFVSFSLLSFQVGANNAVSLNEAVNQVKSEGRVLSAKTINGQHEIKVLTPNGQVKIINKKAGRGYSNSNGLSHQESPTVRNKYKGSESTHRLQSNRDVMKLKERNVRSKQGSGFKNIYSNKRHTKGASRTNTSEPKNKDN